MPKFYPVKLSNTTDKSGFSFHRFGPTSKSDDSRIIYKIREILSCDDWWEECSICGRKGNTN